MRTREEQIEQRCQQMPDIHLANYKRAMRGRSMKAAIKAFCLECVCWQKEEVRLCTDLGCPLYPYRPYKNSANRYPERRSFGSESKNNGRGA
ncbi:MAG: hypothetical protein AMJ43_00045 [Coxiella sp. DG_40]|jgi:hypothetical protein|nr:MAG: hypothetical protein AMJ43_00045 [Coxiella sp. DG_40]